MSPLMKFEPSPCSPSTSVSSADSTHLSRQNCPICGDAAWNRHFGVLCCNACAAFFRRTVGNKKLYVCVRSKHCAVAAGQTRHMCKFCRFQRCVWNGMSIAVAMLRLPIEKRIHLFNKPPLRQLISHRKATFVNRFNATVNVYGGRYDTIQIGKKSPTFREIVCAVHAEFSVLMEFLHTSGFGEWDLSSVDLLHLGANVFYSWLCFNSVTNTARNGGYATNAVYFVDESQFPVKPDHVQWFHTTCSELRDPDVAARSAYQLMCSVVNAAGKLHHARLDDAESATMCQIMNLRVANRLFPKNQRLQLAMNSLFENLRIHYEENYDDVAIRMGNLVLLTNEIEAITHQFNEYVLILNLSGYDTVLSRIIRVEQKTCSDANSPNCESESSPQSLP